MSTHLGWADGDASPDAWLPQQETAQAAFDVAQAGGAAGHAGGFGSRLVTITSSRGAPVQAHGLLGVDKPDQAAGLRHDERRDLEDDANSGSGGVSVGEGVNTNANPLADSTGVADPANLADGVTSASP